MKILKNLFGKNDKIHVDEIAVAPGLLLGDAVINEIGENTNGSYIKWGNGLMIVVCTFNSPVKTTELVGFHWTALSLHKFPETFILPPVLISATCDTTYLFTASDYAGYPKTDSGRLNWYFRSPIDNSFTFKTVYLGRWK